MTKEEGTILNLGVIFSCYMDKKKTISIKT